MKGGERKRREEENGEYVLMVVSRSDELQRPNGHQI